MARKIGSPKRYIKIKYKKDTKMSYETWREDLKTNFKESLDGIKKLSENTNINVDEIHRMQLSLLMSLYDYTIHEIVRYKMVDIYEGVAEKSRQYDFFKVSMKTLQDAINKPDEPLSWLPQGVSFQNDTTSYINPKKTLEALSLVTDKNMFKEYCTASKEDYDKFFKYMTNLNSRRNKIVHSMDITNKYTLERNQIEKSEIDEALEKIEKLVSFIIDEI